MSRYFLIADLITASRSGIVSATCNAALCEVVARGWIGSGEPAGLSGAEAREIYCVRENLQMAKFKFETNQIQDAMH